MEEKGKKEEKMTKKKKSIKRKEKEEKGERINYSKKNSLKMAIILLTNFFLELKCGKTEAYSLAFTVELFFSLHFKNLL